MEAYKIIDPLGKDIWISSAMRIAFSKMLRRQRGLTANAYV